MVSSNRCLVSVCTIIVSVCIIIVSIPVPVLVGVMLAVGSV